MFTILFAIVALAVAATWVIPAGRYATVRYDAGTGALVVEDGQATRSLPATQAALSGLGIRAPIDALTVGNAKPLAVPGTYARASAAPQPLQAVITAPIAGAIASADIFLFILIIGGFIGTFNRSGAFDAGVAALGNKLAGREHWLIVALTLLFGLGGTVYGMAEETIAFYPLLAPLLLRAGYDRIVPIAVIFGGSQFGCLAATINPFSVIIASATIGVRWTDGIAVRAGLWLVILPLLICWTLRYAARVRRDPARSLAPAGGPPAPALANVPACTEASLDARARLLLALFAGTFALMIFGVSRLGWWFPEMSALFLGSAILAARLQPGEGRAKAFFDGAAELIGVAAIVGLGRAIMLVLASGQIDATLIHAAGAMLAGAPEWLFLLGTYGFYILVSLVNNSSSSTAALTMPLFGPVASVVGVDGHRVVSAYLFGHNLLSTLTPAGLALPSLAMMAVPIGAWVRFILPLLLVVAVMSVAALLVL
jgi:uncharacterized ion transporter superfamily protein YfcC